MATKPPVDNPASFDEPEEVLATTQLQVRALGLTGALMQNITAIAPAITAFFFTATIVGFTGAISPFAYFLGFLIYSLVKSFSPFPASPNNWSPLIVGAWMLLGVAVLAVLKRRGGGPWRS